MQNETIDTLKVLGYITSTDDSQGIANKAGITPYELPVASSTTLGGVKVGDGLAIDGSGKLSVDTNSSLIIYAKHIDEGGLNTSDPRNPNDEVINNTYFSGTPVFVYITDNYSGNFVSLSMVVGTQDIESDEFKIRLFYVPFYYQDKFQYGSFTILMD